MGVKGTVVEGTAQAQSNDGGCYSAHIFLTWEYTRFSVVFFFLKKVSKSVFFKMKSLHLKIGLLI